MKRKGIKRLKISGIQKNHWSNNYTMITYISHIIIPCEQKTSRIETWHNSFCIRFVESFTGQCQKNVYQ